MTCIVLCGGAGAGLWPLSRNAYPKQFVNLIGDESLFKQTLRRNHAICDSSLVVTNFKHVFIAAGQYDELSLGGKKVEFLVEPVGRNTAPAIALACLHLNPDEIVLVSASDHLIRDEYAYRKLTQEALLLAEQGHMVTFGIKPEYPETGYGNLECNKTAAINMLHAFEVVSFREKPEAALANQFLESGRFLWNSGMFAFKTSVFLDELALYSPDIYQKSKVAFMNATICHDEGIGHRCIRIKEDDMQTIPSESIDCAVIEKSDNVVCVESSMGWSDLGSFDSLFNVQEKDDSGNSIDQNMIEVGSRNNLVISAQRRIALVGISDCIIIDTEDSILIAKRGESQGVKLIVEQLKAGLTRDCEMTELDGTGYRPWGRYTLLDVAGNFKIKRIVVKPGKKLSLQKHMHRSEHWVVVSGTATVTVEEEIRTIRTNESVYIPITWIHRLENKEEIDLVIIETQVGQYLGEDDVIRLDDDYGRT